MPQSGSGSQWLSVDPMAEKYPAFSPYVYAANDPVSLTDNDGREIVDQKGRTVSVSFSSNGTLTFSRNATSSIRTIANALNRTETGRAQLKGIIKSDVKVHMVLSGGTRIVHANGTKTMTFCETVQGNYDAADNYAVFQRSDGTLGIKEATMTVFKGTIKEAISDATAKLSGLTIEQAIGAVAGHESVHATDENEINKDLQQRVQTGGLRPASEREKKPNEIEQRIIDESKRK